MDLRQMEYLVALADERQFTRAAAVCGISQSGLSAAIRGLEEELGTALFTRSTRGVEATAAGRALLPHARTMLAQAASARDAVTRASAELTGRLRIGTEQCLGVVDVHGLLEQVHRRHPLVDLEFTQAGSHDLVTRTRDDQLDLAFVAATEHAGALHAVELGRLPLVLLAPHGHPLAQEREVGWRALDGADFVDFPESWAIRSLNDAVCGARGVERRVRCAVNDVHALIDLVRRGLGVAIVPAHVAAKPEARELATLALPVDAPAWVVSVVARRPSAPATALALEIIRSSPS
ncbi:LysR family transcriptional regulator [Microbacterium sp. NPDC055683]